MIRVSDDGMGARLRPRVMAASTMVALALGLAACGDSGNGNGGASADSGTGQPDATAAAGASAPTGVVRDVATGTDAANAEADSPNAPVDTGQGVAEDARISSKAVPPDWHARLPAVQASAGSWSAPIAWPVMPIHTALTPDGKVMSYGTNQAGAQGAQFNYDVWDPISGQHTLLPNNTGTDLFCSAQLLLSTTGNLLISGGDIRALGLRDAKGNLIVNRGVVDVNLYNYRDTSLVASGTPMKYSRWYNSMTTLADGRVLTIGGANADNVNTPTPEVYTTGQGWRELPGVTLRMNYPRSFLAPNGRVTVVAGSNIYSVDTAGNGSMAAVGTLPSTNRWELPVIMFDRGKLLAIRQGGAASVIDINGPTPVVTETTPTGSNRYWASGTVLADGQVLLTGGGALRASDQAPNTGTSTALQASIWNPKTGQWTDGASAVKSREYHSTALLLPDATVLVGGGGAPGPVTQLNGEIYSPPYLFNAAGQPATRPVIVGGASELKLGADYALMMSSTQAIKRVTLVRTGSGTHSVNFEQRFLDIPFSQQGNRLTLSVNESSNVVPPGYYMVFAFDSLGVPSVARIVHVNPTTVATTRALSASISSFAGNTSIAMNGSADVGTTGAMVLTPAKYGQAGSAWYRAPLALDANTSFSSRFQFKIGGGNGADGLAFVLQGNDTMALGGSGGGLGYAGIGKSVAVKVDTYSAPVWIRTPITSV